MPRVSGAYTMGERTVVKGGYGLFFDTLNAGDYTGFNQTRLQLVDDQRLQHRLRPDLAARAIRRNGISPLVDPFPVRLGGGRFEQPIEDALGVNSILGTSFTREDPESPAPAGAALADRRAARTAAQHFAVEIAYAGSYADRVGRNINEVVRAGAVLQQPSPTSATPRRRHCCSSR